MAGRDWLSMLIISFLVPYLPSTLPGECGFAIQYNKEEGGRNIIGRGMAKNVWPRSTLFSADLKGKKRVRDKNIKACIVHIPAILHIPTQLSRPADKFVVKDQA
jgi:hypothetical protein